MATPQAQTQADLIAALQLLFRALRLRHATNHDLEMLLAAVDAFRDALRDEMQRRLGALTKAANQHPPRSST